LVLTRIFILPADLRRAAAPTAATAVHRDVPAAPAAAAAAAAAAPPPAAVRLGRRSRRGDCHDVRLVDRVVCLTLVCLAGLFGLFVSAAPIRAWSRCCCCRPPSAPSRRTGRPRPISFSSPPPGAAKGRPDDVLLFPSILIGRSLSRSRSLSLSARRRPAAPTCGPTRAASTARTWPLAEEAASAAEEEEEEEDYPAEWAWPPVVWPAAAASSADWRAGRPISGGARPNAAPGSPSSPFRWSPNLT